MTSAFLEGPHTERREGWPPRRRLGWPWSAIAWLLDVNAIEELFLPDVPDMPDTADKAHKADKADKPPADSGNRQ